MEDNVLSLLLSNCSIVIILFCSKLLPYFALIKAPVRHSDAVRDLIVGADTSSLTPPGSSDIRAGDSIV